jgi:hypothetical protein
VAAPVGEAVGVITVELPEHIVGLDTDEIAIVGVVLTVIVVVMVLLLGQFKELVPTTE